MTPVRILAGAAAVASTLALGTGASAQIIPAPTCKGQEATIWTPDEDGVYRGTPGADVIVAGEGDDEIVADANLSPPFERGNADVVCAGGGDDRISGGAGADGLYGEEGDDVIDAGGGSDRVEGGSGDDALHGDAGTDTLLGEAGVDGCTGGRGRDTCDGGAPGRGDEDDPDDCYRDVERPRRCSRPPPGIYMRVMDVSGLVEVAEDENYFVDCGEPSDDPEFGDPGCAKPYCDYHARVTYEISGGSRHGSQAGLPVGADGVLEKGARARWFFGADASWGWVASGRSWVDNCPPEGDPNAPSTCHINQYLRNRHNGPLLVNEFPAPARIVRLRFVDQPQAMRLEPCDEGPRPPAVPAPLTKREKIKRISAGGLARGFTFEFSGEHVDDETNATGRFSRSDIATYRVKLQRIGG